jgi:Clostripain family
VAKAASKKRQVRKKSSNGRGARRTAKRTVKRTDPAPTGEPKEPAAELPSRWTVMVYMAAEDTAELDAHAIRDLLEMEHAAMHVDVDVLVQINRFWPQDPQRYALDRSGFRYVGKASDDPPRPPTGPSQTPPTVAPTGQPQEKVSSDMGAQLTFGAFLDWAGRFYAEETKRGICRRQFFLVLWGHAYGLGFGRDHGDPLTLVELTSELKRFNDTRGRPLELLGANACAMSYAEAAFQLSQSAQFLVASQVAVPFAGWPYDAILSRIEAGMTPEDVGRLVVDRYVTHFASASSQERVAMSLVALGPAIALKGLIGDLTAALSEVIDGSAPGSSNRLAHVRAAFLATAAGDVRPLIDLVDLCGELLALATDLRVIEPEPPTVTLDVAPLARLEGAALAVIRFVEPSSTLVDGKGDEVSACLRFYKHHAALDDLHGVGIFAPFVTDGRDLKRLGLSKDNKQPGRTDYRDLGLVVDPDPKRSWDTLVYDALNSALPTEVVAGIEGSGAGTREDRAAVAQMLASVDSIFDILERRLAATLRTAVSGSTNLSTTGPVSLNAAKPLGALQLLSFAALEQSLPKKKRRPPTSPTKVVGHTKQNVGSLESLEAMIADVERAVRRTLTNGTFGLGPGRSDSDGPKPSLGAGEVKPSLGAIDPKPSLGPEPKPRLGGPTLAPGIASDGESTAISAVAELFREIGLALRQLEEATGAVELLAAQIMLGAAGSASVPASANAVLSQKQLERAFKVVADAAVDARRTLRRVLSHPAYGFGPGAVRMTAAEREALARMAGLNSRDLVLL